MPITLPRTLDRANPRYTGAVSIVAASFLLRHLLVQATGQELPPYITFYPAVMFVAIRAGFWPGVLASAVSAAVADYTILPPTGSFAIRKRSDVVAMLFFLAMGVLMSLVADLYRRGQRKLAASTTEALRNTQGKLDQVEAQFETLANSIPQLCWMANPGGWVFWYNRGWYEYTGTTLEQMQGWSWQSVHDPKTLPKVLEQWNASIATGAPFHMVFPLLGRDGKFRSFLTRVLPVRNAEGNVVRWFGTNTDIDEQTQIQTELRTSKDRLDLALEVVSLGEWELDLQRNVGSHSQRHAEIFGYDAPQAGWTFEMFLNHVLPEHRAEVDACARAARLNGASDFETRIRRADGVVRWIWVRGRCLLDEMRQPARMFGTVMDISERKQAEEDTKRLLDAVVQERDTFSALLNSMNDEVWFMDKEKRLSLVNQAALTGSGIHAAAKADLEETYRHVEIRRPDGSLRPLEHAPALRALRGEVVRYEEEAVRHLTTGELRHRELNAAPIRDAAGNIVGSLAVVRDITQRKADQERINFLAYYDALTELPHRILLQDRLDSALASARRGGERLALLFLDLDRFKAVNDSFGHTFGDSVLKEVAKRLKQCAGETNTVARAGGDEFLVLLNGIRDAADAAVAAERILDAMKPAFLVQGHSLSLGCSIGISVYPEHGEDGDVLIRNADAAMYSAKESGRNIARFYTEEMNAQAIDRLTMDRDLRLALERGEFYLVYQPQMHIESARVTGFEALIRWKHPQFGLIPPDKFISDAENNGLILPIGEWVLRTACSQAQAWRDAGLLEVPVAVNVSAIQFRQENFCGLVRQVLFESGLEPQYLELELTESMLLSNADVILSVLQELKDMGVKLAIDDFGTGYSNFSYLRHFSVDKIKIDKSFARDVVVDSDDAAIAAAIISMARSLHITVIAEGVEDEAQMAFMRQHRCDEIQGHFFSKPLPVDETTRILRREQRNSTQQELLHQPASTRLRGTRASEATPINS